MALSHAQADLDEAGDRSRTLLELARHEASIDGFDVTLLKQAQSREARARSAVDALEQLLAQAARRDEIQATRPDGCACLGLGAWGERFVPDGEGGGIPVRTDYCSCPDGRAAQAEDDRVRSAYRSGLRQARLERYFGDTQVPHRYASATLDSYPVTPDTDPIVERLRGFAASCGQREGRSLLLWGAFGVGKTGLAVATMRAAIETHGIDALFVTVPDLLNEIRSTFGGGAQARLPYADDHSSTQISAGKLQQAVRETSLLILDDLGAEKPSVWTIETLFALINHRYVHELRTIFTSNLSPQELASEQHLGERTAWRIVEMSDIVPVLGPNLRVAGAR